MNTRFNLITRAAALLTLMPDGRANVLDARFDGTGDFSYGIEFMTDLDQRRAGLPGDGKAFCVPASAMNLFAYAANFGFPQLFPGPGLWEGVPRHEEMTAYLQVLGQLMSTDADNGTTLSGQTAGFAGWLQLADLASMPVVTIARDDDYWPTVDVGAFMGTAGAVVNFAYGRYQWTPGPMGQIWLTNRNMGHSVTLQRAVADNGQTLGPRPMRMHNPSGPSDGNLLSNSAYFSQDLPDAENLEVGLDADNDGDFEYFTATSLVEPPPDDNRFRLLDSVTGLYPPGGMSYSEVEVNAQFVGGGLGFVTDRKPVTHTLPAGTSLVSVIPHPELHSGLALLRGAAGEAVHQLPHGSGRSQRLVDLPRGSKFLVLGYGQSVYAVGTSSITGLEVRSRDASRLGSVALPSQVRATALEAAAYNEATDELLVISGTGSRLFVFDAATLRLSATYVLKSPTVPGTIRSLTVLPAANSNASSPTAGAPASPRRVLVALASGALGQLDYGTTTGVVGGLPVVALTRLVLPGVSDPLSADVDGGGRLYVADRRSGLLEFVVSGAGKWERARQPFYSAGQGVGRKFAAFRSRSNLRPGIHDQPEWSHTIDGRD
jgi:hypothetical protein